MTFGGEGRGSRALLDKNDTKRGFTVYQREAMMLQLGRANENFPMNKIFFPWLILFVEWGEEGNKNTLINGVARWGLLPT